MGGILDVQDEEKSYTQRPVSQSKIYIFIILLKLSLHKK